MGRVGPVFHVEGLSGDGITPCVARGPGKAAVVGDLVQYVSEVETVLAEGLIEAVGPRNSELIRTDATGKRPQILAANIDCIFIVNAITPELREGLIDRYLVAASAQGLDAHIVVNKIDLLDAAPDIERIEARMAEFRALGYPVSLVSAATGLGMEALLESFQSQCSIVVGHSGVGKTSLLNAICPDVSEKVQEISAATGRGQHTTTTSALYRLPGGGELIDSPGVRSFGLWGIDANSLREHFAEFVHLAGGCRFGDCQHIAEPQCAVRAAVESGEISERRYASYLSIRESLLTGNSVH